MTRKFPYVYDQMRVEWMITLLFQHVNGSLWSRGSEEKMFGDLEGQFFFILYSYTNANVSKSTVIRISKLSSKGKCFDINKILPTNFLRNFMEIILEKLYVDNGA